jgi:hypothetical protein
LEAEFHATNGVTALRATRLTDEQVGIAETAFMRLERDEDLLTAVDHWLRTGKPATIKKSPRLDEALKAYEEWLETTMDLRPITKGHLRRWVGHFVRNVANVRVTDVLPDHIEKYLTHRNVSPNIKDANCRAISSFFTWCMKGKRHWAIIKKHYQGRVSSEDTKKFYALWPSLVSRNSRVRSAGIPSSLKDVATE